MRLDDQTCACACCLCYCWGMSVDTDPPLTTTHPRARWWVRLAPVVLGVLCFAAGVGVIFSGIYPVLPNRLPMLSAYIILPLVEASHVLASLTGLALMVLAHGLGRRSQGAWVLAILTLAAAGLCCLLRALDVGIAASLWTLAGVIVVARPAFYRPARAFAEPLSGGEVLAIVAVIGVSIVAGYMAYADQPIIEHSFNFGFRDDAPRFWRASVVLAIATFVLGVARLQATQRPRVTPADAATLERLLPVIAAEPSTHAWLALMGDKQVLVSDSGRSFLMYAAHGRTLVAMGDPCGDTAEASELIWRLRELADTQGARVAFVHLTAERLPLYLDLGLTIRKLGEEARVNLLTFNTDGKAWRNMRNNRSALLRRGIALEIVPASGVDAIMTDLKRVSDVWRTRQNGPEKGFSLGRFDPDYVRNMPVAVMRLDGQIIAFANLWIGASKAEIAVDLMRHIPDAPHGVMDVMFIELMLWAQAAGYRWFNLGRAPLSGLIERPLAPLWHHLGALVFKRAARFYRFEGLRLYKQKFGPDWRPFYLASPPGLGAIWALYDTAALVSKSERYAAPRLNVVPLIDDAGPQSDPIQSASQ